MTANLVAHQKRVIENLEISKAHLSTKLDLQISATYDSKAQAAELLVALKDCARTLKNIEAFIGEETDKKIQVGRPNWAKATNRIWHELGTPLAEAEALIEKVKGKLNE